MRSMSSPKAVSAKYGLLPANGWDPNNIVDTLDLVILGMHAKKDNPGTPRGTFAEYSRP